MRASSYQAQHRPCGSVATSQRHSPSDSHNDMALHHGHALLHLAVLLLAIIASLVHQVQPLPVTLLEDTKAAEPRSDTKVKRSHMGESLTLNSEANSGAPVAYYSNPSAAKRDDPSSLNSCENQTNGSSEAPNLKPEEDLSADWDQQPAAIYEAAKQEALAKELFGADDNPFDDKTITDYEKGFHYGTNKAKLDEQMENAILKSEMYGDPSSINQYRYYGDDRRRKRSNAKRSIRFSNRYKREVDLSPEDILTLLSLWDEDRLRQPVGYRTNWPRYNSDVDMDNDRDENDIDEPDESWLESPVYPGMRNPVHMPEYPHHSASPYANGFEAQPPVFASKRQWGGFGDKKRKRFMVSRKRSDPTRELRYLNGPASGHDDIYSLTQLLGPPPPREMGFPVYHRMVL